MSLARLYMSITEPHMYAVPVRLLLLPFTKKATTEDRKHPFHEHGRWLQKDEHPREPRGERLLIVGPEKHVVLVTVSQCRWRP